MTDEIKIVCMHVREHGCRLMPHRFGTVMCDDICRHYHPETETDLDRINQWETRGELE